ncbi:MAG: ATP-binding cassette domain-containing protein [Magnetococcus sp. YQC-5]
MDEPILRLDSIVLPMAHKCQPMDLVVSRGEIWVITGATGSGKTTLFKVMSGLIQPLQGTVTLFGTNLNQAHVKHVTLLRRRMGVLLESDGLIPSWTVYENLALPWRYYNLLPKQELEPFLHAQLLQYQEDVSLLHKVVATLTLEQRVRMALIRALQKNPELLLIDNDMLALHLPRLLKFSWTRKLEEKSGAMVLRGVSSMTTFLPRESLRLAILQNGTLLATGSLRELSEHPDPKVVMTIKEY